MKMEKVCQLLVANFKESCGGETFSLCKYFSENIQTRDNDKNLVSGPRKNKTTSTIYPFWVPVKRVVSPHLYASIHIRPLSKPLYGQGSSNPIFLQALPLCSQFSIVSKVKNSVSSEIPLWTFWMRWYLVEGT